MIDVDDRLYVVGLSVSASYHRDGAERAVVEATRAAITVVEIDDGRRNAIRRGCPWQHGKYGEGRDEIKPQLPAWHDFEQGVACQVEPVESELRGNDVKICRPLADGWIDK